jgi:hypothetical protein
MYPARLLKTRQTSLYSACCSALLVIALSGCSQEHLPPVATLTVWQAPGTTQVSSVFGLHSGPGKGIISHVSTYLANLAKADEPHILLTEDSELFDVRLDGSDLRSRGLGCESEPFAIPATFWIACEASHTMILIDRQDPTARQRLTGAEGIYPSWTSDGSRVALVEAGCVVALYEVSLTQFNLTPYARLVIPEDLCHMYGIALAPDGAWLVACDP